MKTLFKYMSLLTLLCVSVFAVGQNTPDSSKQSVPPVSAPSSTDDNPVYTVVEEMPEFPGGMDAMFNYLKKNIEYPKKARKENISGRVYVTFTVRPDGSVTNVSVLRSPHELLSTEAIRVVKQMPKWKPGKQNGKVVSVQYNLPVNFNL